MLLLWHQCACGSGLKREIQIPSVAKEFFRALVLDAQSSLEVGTPGLTDNRRSTCFPRMPSAMSWTFWSGFSSSERWDYLLCKLWLQL